MKWEELPLADRARLMQVAVRNGYTDIRSIKEAYANFQNQRQATGNRFEDGGPVDDGFEVVNPLDSNPILNPSDEESVYDTEDTGYTPWFVYGTEHQPDRPMTNQEYYTIMEGVARQNNPVWNEQRRAEGMPELTPDEEYARLVNDNTYDYRGYYNDPTMKGSNGNADSHWPDTWKTAYHPTFSNESLYSGMVDPVFNPSGRTGGSWDEETFIPEGYAYSGNLFHNGGKSDKKAMGGVRGLLGLFDKHKIKYIVTSGLRKGSKTSSGNTSWHSHADKWGNSKAFDVVPANGDFDQFRESIYSNPEIVAYMKANNLGILEEITPDVMKRTHASGKHFHIGPDKWAISMRDSNISKFSGTYHPMQEITWQDVQNRGMRTDLTPEEEKLLNSRPTLFYDADYIDWNDPSNKTAFEQMYAPYALNPEYDRPANGWELYNNFLAMQNSSSQGDDLLTQYLVSHTPGTTSKQPAADWLFNMSGDGGQLYHGLNFAAYGGKVNKFDKGGKYTDAFMNEMGLRWVPADQVVGDYREDVMRHNPNGAYAVDVNNNYVPASRMESLWTDYLTRQEQPDIATAREVELAQQHRANERFNKSVDAAAIGLMSIPGLVPVASTVLPFLAPGTIGGTLLGETTGSIAIGELLNEGSRALTGRDWGENLRWGLEGTADMIGLGYDPESWSPYVQGAYTFLTDMTNPGYYSTNILKGAANSGRELLNKTKQIYDNGTLWDKYTTFGGRFGYYGNSPMDRFTGTIQRRFNIGTPKASKPELLRKIDQPITQQSDGQIVLSSPRFYKDGKQIENVNFTMDRFVVPHKKGTWDLMDGYIIDPELVNRYSFQSIEPSDMFNYGSHITTEPTKVTLVSGNVTSLNNAQKQGLSTLSSPRLRQLYQNIQNEATRRSGLSKIELADLPPLDRTDQALEYAAEIQRLKTTRGNPTVGDFKLLEQETGLNSFIQGKDELAQYNAWIERLLQMKNAGTLSQIPFADAGFTFPNNNIVGAADVFARHRHTTLPTYTIPYNNVLYDPATEADALYRIHHNIIEK